MIRRKSPCAAHAAWLMPLGVLASTATAAAFSGEDPLLGNPFHHELISHQAAVRAGWKTATAEPPFRPLADQFKAGPDHLEAGESIAWHADYIDSYLYNPLWWAAGGIDRYKAAKATQKELEKLHFDDLFTTDKVETMWRRYASGTFAGLLWAKEKNDVAAAQHLVGVSLHAMQDFYSHSNWVDDPARRTDIYTSSLTRSRMALFTGSYEHPAHLGQKTHGKWLPECAILNQAEVSSLLALGCDHLPMLVNDDLCDTYRACRKGEVVRPSISGLKLPSGIMYLAPPGIALDNTWVADIAVRERGLKDLTGVQAFNFARDLAQRQSVSWLTVLEREMSRVPGGTEFWNRVKTTPSSKAQRTAQFEKYNQLPFLFLAAGPYPPTGSTDEVYLRLRLKTSGDANSGTNADIWARAGGQSTLLDYLPVTNKGLVDRAIAYNDFERGDDDAYVIGPFNRLPAQIELYNDSASTGEVFGAAWRSLVEGLDKLGREIVNIFKGIIGTNADHVATNTKTWMPKDLEEMGFGAAGERNFTVELNGGGEGHYRAHGTIHKAADDGVNRSLVVRINRLQCVKESKWDRGSDSDEPFLLAVLIPSVGKNQEFRTQPITRSDGGKNDGIDDGEWATINHSFKFVILPTDSGMLQISLALLESDDETSATRDRLLATFAGRIEANTAPAKRGFIDALSTAIAADWKIEHLEVFAWSRNGTIHTGKVFDARVNRLIKGRSGATFALDAAPFRSSGVSTNDLLNPYTLIKIDRIKPTLPPGVGDIIKQPMKDPKLDTVPQPQATPVPNLPIPPLPRPPIPRPVPRVLPR